MTETERLKELLKDIKPVQGVIYTRMPDGTMVAWHAPKPKICKKTFDSLFEDDND